jgi:hypothetical protein
MAGVRTNPQLSKKQARQFSSSIKKIRTIGFNIIAGAWNILSTQVSVKTSFHTEAGTRQPAWCIFELRWSTPWRFIEAKMYQNKISTW